MEYNGITDILLNDDEFNRVAQGNVMEEAERESATRALQGTPPIDPATARKNQALSEATGIPRPKVDADPTGMERRASANKAIAAVDRTTYTRAFLADPENAQFMIDDTEAMVQAEASMGVFQTAIAAFMGSRAQTMLSQSKTREIFEERGILDLGGIGELTPSERAELQREAEFPVPKTEGATDWVRAGASLAGQMWVNLSDALGAGATVAAATGGVGAVAGAGAGLAAGGVGAIPGAAIGFVVGAVPGFKAGMTGGFALSAGAMEFAPQYEALIARGVSEENAFRGALAYAMGAGALEMLGAKGLSAATRKAATAMFKKEAADQLAQLTAKQIGAKVLKSQAKGVATETSTELAQEALAWGSEYIATAVEDLERPTSRELAERMSETAVEIAKGTIVLGGLGGGVSLAADVRTARQSRQAITALRSAVDATGRSEVAKTLPSRWKTFLATIGADNAIEKVFINKDRVRDVLEQNDIDIEQLREVDPDLVDQLETEDLGNPDAELDVASFITGLGQTEIGVKLTEHIRPAVDAMSEAEIQQMPGRVKKMVKALGEVFDEEQSGENTVMQIANMLAGQIVQTGQYSREGALMLAIAVGHAVKTISERGGMDPIATAQAMNIKIVDGRVQLEAKPVDVVDFQIERARKVKQGKQLFPTDAGPRLSTFLKSKGGIKDAGGELANLDLQKAIPALVTNEGMDLDSATRAAWEAGYLTGEDRPGIDALIEALSEEAQGNIRYDRATREGMDALQSGVDLILERLEAEGVDIETASNEEVKKALGYEPDAVVVESDGDVLEQRAVEDVDAKDLMVVQHNLTAENLLHADEVGGLAVPSLAVSKAVQPLEGFGEITLVASPSLLETTGTRVFNADVYSPRYPRVKYKVSAAALRKAWDKQLAEASELTGNRLSSDLDVSDVEDRGLEAFEESPAVKVAYLLGQGKTFKPVKTKARLEILERAPGLRKFIEKEDRPWELAKDEDFVAAWDSMVEDYITEKRRKLVDKGYDEFPSGWEKHQREMWYEDDGKPSYRRIREIEGEVRSIREAGRVDYYPTKEKAEKMVRPKRAEFRAWVKENFAHVITGEVVGEEKRSGGMRWYPHTLDNVVSIMKKKLRDGEDFNYGVGSIRSTVAKEFKSVSQIRKSRDAIVGVEDFERVKEETEREFFALAETWGKKSATADGESFGFLDAFSEHMKEAVIIGVNRVAQKYYSGISEDEIAGMVDFLDKLRNMETGYFEAKVQRAVNLDEFVAAVVPRGSDKRAVEAAKKHGLTVHYYNKKDKNGRAKAIEAANRKHKKGVLFQAQTPNAKGQKLGQVQFLDDETIITLFERANESTLIHEFGHVFLRLMGVAAAQDGATESLRQDFAVVREWLGAAPDGAMTRDHEEKFARAWEKYHREGVAPLEALKYAFKRFSAWLRGVYKRADEIDRAAGQEINLTPEIRAVFDRMIASEAEIAETRNADIMSFIPMEGLMEGMGKVEQERYIASVDDAREEAIQASVQEAYRMEKAAKREWAKAARKRIKEAVEAEIDATPVYRAIAFLAQGKWDGEGPAPTWGKLNTTAIVNEYGEEALPHLRVSNKSIHSEDGAHPDIVAARFGFDSGYDLIMALSNARSRSKAVQEETKKRFGEELKEWRSEQGQDPVDKVLNGKREQHLAMELKLLAQRSKNSPTPLQLIKKAAQDAILGMDLKAARRAGSYRQKSMQHMRRALEAFANEDYDTAYREKQAQLVFHFKAQFAEEAKERVRIINRRLKSAAKNAKGNVKAEYWYQLEKLLARFGFAMPIQRADVPSLQAFLDAEFAADPNEDIEQLMGAPQLADFLVSDEGYAKKFEELTLWEAQRLDEAVSLLRGKGKEQLKNGLYTMDMTVDEAVAESRANMGGMKTKKNIFGREVFTDSTGWREYLASTTMLAFSLDMADGFTHLFKQATGDIGILRRMFEKLADGDSAKIDAQRKIVEGMKPHKKVLQGFLRRMKGRVRELDAFNMPQFKGRAKGYWTAEKMVAFILNLGNDSNAQRMKDGSNLGDAEFVALTRAITSLMTPQELEAIQGIGDVVESLWEEMAATHENLYHFRPEKIEAREITFTAKGGEEVTLRGWYYPLAYDGAVNRDVKTREQINELRQTTNGFLTTPVPEKGFTKGRLDRVTDKPVRLDLGVLARHFDTVTTFTHILPPLMDLYRVAKNREWEDEFTRVFGVNEYEALRESLKYIANPGVTQKMDVITRGAMALKSMATAMILGLNPGVAAKQLLSVPGGLNDSSYRKYVRHGVGMLVTHPRKAYKTMIAKSPYMADRFKGYAQEIVTESRGLGAIPTKRAEALKWAQDKSFIMITMADFAAVFPMWNAVYETMKREGKTEAEAVRRADEVIRSSQPSGRAIDRAGVQRNHKLSALVSMFMTFTLKFGNRLRYITNGVKQNKVSAKDVGKFTLMELIVPGIAMTMINLGLHGDEEDWENFPQHAGMTVLSMLTAGLPVIRDAAGWLSREFMGEKQFGGPIRIPVQSVLDNMERVGKRSIDAVTGEKEPEELLYAVAELAAIWWRVPVHKAYYRLQRMMEE